MTRAFFSLVMLCGAAAQAGGPTAQEILDRVLDADTWGLSDAEVSARLWIRDGSGKVTKELAFRARSVQYDRPNAKSVIRFTAPADTAGVGFLQIQHRSGDDERHLFLPDLKKSRRIGGTLRSQAFMGTTFSYADLDRKELRDSDPVLVREEKIAKYDCYLLETKPRGPSPQYTRAELWVRKDNFMPLRWHLYGASGEKVKTLTAKEVTRVKGRWFITRSLMVDHADHDRSTELHLEEVNPSAKVPDAEFTVRHLEKA